MKHETFTEVYERYAALIMKSVVAQTNDRELAMEICQQTFLAYYRKMDALDTELVKSWLLHVSQNLLIDHWRKASTRNEIVHEDTRQKFMDLISEVNVDKQMTDRMFLRQLLRELKEENEIWYEVIDHICIRGERYEEAAKQLGISPAVLRARLYRARCFLQKKYGKDYFDGR